MQETSLVSLNYVQKWLHVDNGRLTVTPHCRFSISFCTEEHVVYWNTPTASPAVLNSFKLSVFFVCTVIMCSRNTADVDQVNRYISSRTNDALSFTIVLTCYQPAQLGAITFPRFTPTAHLRANTLRLRTELVIVSTYPDSPPVKLDNPSKPSYVIS